MVRRRLECRAAVRMTDPQERLPTLFRQPATNGVRHHKTWSHYSCKPGAASRPWIASLCKFVSACRAAMATEVVDRPFLARVGRPMQHPPRRPRRSLETGSRARARGSLGHPACGARTIPCRSCRQSRAPPQAGPAVASEGLGRHCAGAVPGWRWAWLGVRDTRGTRDRRLMSALGLWATSCVAPPGLFEQRGKRKRGDPDNGRGFGNLRIGFVDVDVDARGAPILDERGDIGPTVWPEPQTRLGHFTL